MAKKKRRKNKNNGSVKTVIIAAVVTFVVGVFIVTKYGGRFMAPSTTPKPSAPTSRVVELYLSDTEGLMLKAMEHTIAKGTIEKELKEAIGALIGDPSSTIPQGTRLLGVSVKGEVAFVDFSSEIVKNHPGGSSGETQTIYSIVDTAVLNFPQVKEVQILVEGKTEQTLAGHIDISLPLEADKDIIAN